MSSSDVMISARGLSKAYKISHNAMDRPTTLAEAAVRRVRDPFARDKQETFWALKDVSFDVMRGDVVGVIGRNGAGKSTLFKVLSRITEPTAGEVDIYGRVGSLLEVGTGFSGELTGRENIYLNGSILGMRRSEITKRFDQIVDFAGVEKFLDTPVKRYSSGMYVRLAFAVAAHLETEILIVDEVLSVGDAEFQQKCLGKMREVAGGGRTVLLVSHNMASVRALCVAAIYLRNGEIRYQGAVEQAAQKYSEVEIGNRDRIDFFEPPKAIIWLRAMSIHPARREANGSWDVAAPLRLRLEVVKKERDHPFEATVRLESSNGNHVFSCFAGRTSAKLKDLPPGGYAVDFSIRAPNLVPDNYSWSIWLHDPMRELYDYKDNIFPIKITNSAIDFSRLGNSQILGPSLLDADEVTVEPLR